MVGSFQSGLNQFSRKNIVGMENENTRVKVALGYTLNLGNFQSLRIDLEVSDNKRDGENTNEAFERVYSFVEDKLAEKVKEASQEIESK
jgi:hypothetical protein